MLKAVKGIRTKGHNCCYCEVALKPGQATREHIIPKHTGGRVIQPSCQDCNAEKGGLTLENYLRYLLALAEAYRLGDVTLCSKKLRRTRVKIKNAIKFLKLLYPGEWDYL